MSDKQIESAKNQPIERCEDKKRRINLKNKRMKNYVKKGIELAAMLDMDIYLVLNDKDSGKVSEYTSGNNSQGHFNLDKAIQFLGNYKRNGGFVKVFDDNDYHKLKLTQSEVADEEFENKM